VLHQEHALSEVFVAFLLARNARFQADLVDQLFNSREKRLARILLLLAQFGKETKPEKVVPKISQEYWLRGLARPVPEVFFHESLQKTGFIEYNGGIQDKPEHDSLSATGSLIHRSHTCPDRRRWLTQRHV
jgi:CRP/FNR family cyclic AMP-dependent transcriptional regulator